jgi:hypothetical protein
MTFFQPVDLAAKFTRSSPFRRTRRARTRVSGAPRRELRRSPAPRDVPPSRDAAFFPREAFSLKNSSCHQKSLWTHFLALFLRGLSRVISGYLYQSRVISTDFIYTRERAIKRPSDPSRLDRRHESWSHTPTTDLAGKLNTPSL